MPEEVRFRFSGQSNPIESVRQSAAMLESKRCIRVSGR